MRQHERPIRSEIWTVLETVGLADRADDKAQTYSFGMKQRLVLAQALLPMPALLVFDEPTDGLDPIAVVELRGLHFFKELRPYLFTNYIGYWRGLFREQVVWSDLLQNGGKMLAFTFAFLSIAYHRFRIRQEI